MASDSTPVAQDPNAISPPRWRAILPRLLLSLLIAGGFVWLLQRGGLPVLPPTAAWQELAWWAAPVFFALCLGSNVLRTYRWVHLLRPSQPDLSTRYTWGVALVGFAAVVFAPLRMGEVVRPWLIARGGQVRFIQATASVGAERIMDGVMLMSLLAAGLAMATPLSPLPDHIGELQVPVALVPAIASSALLTFIAAFALMAAFYLFRETVARWVHRGLSLVSPKLATFAIAQLDRVTDGLSVLRAPRHRNAFLRDSSLYWAGMVLAHFALLRGVGASVDLAQATVIVGVMGLGALLPSGPGFFGTFQLGAYCGLAMFFPESFVVHTGSIFTFVSYTLQLAINVLCGLAGLKLMASRPPRS